MKAEIVLDGILGRLIIIPETELEKYALSRWYADYSKIEPDGGGMSELGISCIREGNNDQSN